MQSSLPSADPSATHVTDWEKMLQLFTVFFAIPGAMIGVYQLVLCLRMRRSRANASQTSNPATAGPEAGLEMHQLTDAATTTLSVPAVPVFRSPPASADTTQNTNNHVHDTQPDHADNSVTIDTQRRATTTTIESSLRPNPSDMVSSSDRMEAPRALPQHETPVSPAPIPAPQTPPRAVTNPSLNTRTEIDGPSNRPALHGGS